MILALTIGVLVAGGTYLLLLALVIVFNHGAHRH